jgi:hypothetical protein
MQPVNANEIRPLTDDEIARLETALGQPIERDYLAHWLSEAIRAFLLLMTIPPLRERRDELKRIAEQGRQWIDVVEHSRTTRLLATAFEVQQLMSLARTFCDAVGSLARQMDQSVGPGHPRTNIALDAFLDRLLGIAKRAKVRPSTPSRALLGPMDPGPVPAFYNFATAALDIAMDVIRSSPLPGTEVDAALAFLSNVSDQSLVKALERLRGRVGDYRESAAGLVEWGPAADVERDRPDDSESRTG